MRHVPCREKNCRATFRMSESSFDAKRLLQSGEQGRNRRFDLGPGFGQRGCAGGRVVSEFLLPKTSEKN